MDILIIGGSRFVGPLLVERLLRKKHRVTLFNRGLVRSSYRRVKFVQGDRNRGFGLERRFDTVIDMCAYNGDQTRAALDELEFRHFIHVGTAAAYKRSEDFPLTEDSPLGEWPLWGEYNLGKVECENALAKSRRPYAAIRPVYILGPKNYVEREKFIYSRLKAGVPLVIPGNGEAVVQFAFSRDAAEAIALIAEKKAEGAFNCAGDELVTLRGLVEAMGRICGRTPLFRFNPEADGEEFNEAEFPFANENLICSNGRMKALGIKFTPLFEGLKKDYLSHYSKVS